ncbi:unnamed protein product [Orchesella dallaii]|uniref:C2H2-type domain-containing protein n=1 Tax=Orchesella dallaii TaxID=48710 RepID=A0ABP1QE68_9HEXA
MEFNENLRRLSSQFFNEYRSKNGNSISKSTNGPYVDLTDKHEPECYNGSKVSLQEKKKPRNEGNFISLPFPPERCLICYSIISDKIKDKCIINSRTLYSFLELVTDKTDFQRWFGSEKHFHKRYAQTTSSCSTCFLAINQLLSIFKTVKALQIQITELNAKFRNAVKLSRSIFRKNESSSFPEYQNVDSIRSVIIGCSDEMPSSEVNPKVSSASSFPLFSSGVSTPKGRQYDAQEPEVIAVLRPRKPVTYISEDSGEDFCNDFEDQVGMDDPEFIPSEMVDDNHDNMEKESKKVLAAEHDNVAVTNPAELTVESVISAGNVSFKGKGICHPFSIFHLDPKDLGTSNSSKSKHRLRRMYPDKSSIEFAKIRSELRKQMLAAKRKSCDGKIRKPNRSKQIRNRKGVKIDANDQIEIEASSSDNANGIRDNGETVVQVQKKGRGCKTRKGLQNLRSFIHKPKEKLSWSSHAVRARELKAKYPDKSNKEIKAMIRDRLKQQQNVPEAGGLPTRGAVGSGGVRLTNRAKVRKDLEETGKTVFRNVEIRKLDDGALVCGLCADADLAPIECKSIDSVITHINRLHTDLTNAYECDHCKKKFYYHQKLLKHVREKHEKIRYQCHLCGESFGDSSAKYYHVKGVHEKIKPHTCEYCGKSFLVKKDLMIHVRRHTGERPFVCHVCAATFIEKQSMKKHIRLKHPEAKEDGSSMSAAAPKFC